jgi:putative transcription factor
MESSSSGVTIEVDGAKLLVCERCRRFGVEVKKKPSKRITPPVKTVTDIPLKLQKPTRPRPARARTLTTEISEYELAEDYPQRIRTARESCKLTQGEFAQKIGEKLSIVQKLETGKIRPSDTIVEKIDRLLRINLRTPVEEDMTSHHYQKANVDLTIGDIAKPMVKKKDDEEPH